MTDQVAILNDDEITEELLAEAFGRTGISDYVERDLRIENNHVDYTNAVVDIPPGKAFIIDNGRDAMLIPDARAGVALGTDGNQSVYIYYDLSQPEGERIGYHVSSSATPPSHPSLLIATIDMAAQESKPENQTAPVYRRDAITYKENDIDTDGDGVVNAADTAYHVLGGDVDGTVASANVANILGGGVGRFGSDISGDGNALTGLSNLGADTVSVNADGDGWILRISTDEADAAEIVPVVNGTPRPNGIRYTLTGGGSDLYRINGGVVVPNDLIGGGDDGFKLASGATTARSFLIPRLNGEDLVSSAIRFDATEGESGIYQVMAGLRTGQALVAGGADGVKLDHGDTTDRSFVIPRINGVDVIADAMVHIENEGWDVPGYARGFSAGQDGGNYGYDQLATQRTASIPSAVLDPGESAFTAIHAESGVARILSMTIMDEDYDAPPGIPIQIQTEAGGAVYSFKGEPHRKGSLTTPLTKVNTKRARLAIRNPTQVTVTISATCKYIEGTGTGS